MSHDQHLILRIHQFAHRMRFDTCLDTGRFFQLLRFAAVVADLRAILDDRLIAAASQRHINRRSRILIVADVAVAVHTHTDTQRDSHIISDINRLDILQDRKAALLNLFRVLLLDHKQILVIFQLLDDTFHRHKILRNFPVNQGNQQGTAYLLDTLQRLVVVVEIDKSRHQTLVVDLLLAAQNLRLIAEIQH